MKTIITTIIYLQSTAFLLTTALAVPVAAKNEKSVKGSIQAIETFITLLPPDVPFPTLFSEGSGSGRATHLGSFTVAYEFEINLDTYVGVGPAHFVAANGDSIFTEVEGQGTAPTDDGVAYIVETHTIVGGTGRFDGATGSFAIERVISVFTGVTSGSLSGSIVLDKGK
jgi:hypothetical protein